MRPSGTLEILASHASGRLDYLGELADKLPLQPDRRHDKEVAFLAIEGLNVWSSFSRSFYLSCVFRATRTSGAKVMLGKHAQIKSHTQAIDFAVRTMKGAKYAQTRKPPWTWRDEPTWYDPRVIYALSIQLALSNLSKIQAALGLQTAVFAELPIFRNFFAHRNEHTASRVRGLISSSYSGHGFTTRTHATTFLCARLPGRPQNILADYLDDLRNVIGIMPG